MKRRLAALCCLMGAALLLLGATAPVMPTRDFYVNDYANMLFQEHRDRLSELARRMQAETGVELVVICVPHLGNASPREYAQEILSSWDFTSQRRGILLIDRNEGMPYFIAAGDLGRTLSQRDFDAIREESMLPAIRRGNYSIAVLNGYKRMVRSVYEGYGVPIDQDLDKLLQETGGGVNGLSVGALLFLAVALIAVGRSFRVSRKYREKYLYRHDREYKRKDFSNQRGVDDDLFRYRHSKLAGQEDSSRKIKRSGFIVMPDDQEEDGDL